MEIATGTNPFNLFQSWFDEAVAVEINDPDAIALASVNADGMPSVRMVLLRQWSEDGFLFFPWILSTKRGGHRGRGERTLKICTRNHHTKLPDRGENLIHFVGH